MNSLTVVYTTLFVVSIFFLVINAVMQFRIKRVAESTHIIVNSQRTMLLRLVATLSRRIASENPQDPEAQQAAQLAESDAETSNHPRRVQI